MMFKKKFLLLTIIFIVITQILLYTNNNQKTSFRFFKWTLREVSIGKLISSSFFSGLFMSIILNTTIVSNKENNFENIEDDYESPNNNEDIKSKVEIPPQRDIRDTQPTISVNYRVVKNTEEPNLKSDQNSSSYINDKDDWNDAGNDW